MKVFIKNMVCDRCIRTVNNIFNKNNFSVKNVELGEIEIEEKTLGERGEVVEKELEMEGFEIINEKNAKIIEGIKNVIINLVHYNKSTDKDLKYSQIFEQKLLKEYSFLSRIFSETEGVTIENYIIRQRIERVKELLLYNEKTLSEIAYEMNYSSVAHLSSQFKKITGLTPSHFKNIQGQKRQNLDKV